MRERKPIDPALRSFLDEQAAAVGAPVEMSDEARTRLLRQRMVRDEGLAYAQKLAAAGVAVTHLHAPDMHHNFPVHPGTVARFPQCDAALTRIADWLRATLARGR